MKLARLDNTGGLAASIELFVVEELPCRRSRKKAVRCFPSSALLEDALRSVTMTTVSSLPPTRAKTLSLAIAGLLLITVTILFVERSGRPRRSWAQFEYFGVVMAKTTAELINHRGDVVLWQIRTQPKSVVIDVPLKRFREELSRKGDIRLIAEEGEMVGQPPTTELGGMSGEKFLRLIQKYPNASALVLYGTVPRMTMQQIRNLPDRRPKVFVVAIYDLIDKSLFENGVVQAAIVPRFEQVDNEMDWFKRYYTVVTPDTAHLLPRRTAGP